MLMTPPDILSQTMLAIPVWILFEAGLYFSRSIKPRSHDDEDDEMDDAELDEGIAQFDELSDDEEPPRS
jgi:sec-independent protein translocase protein TatC